MRINHFSKHLFWSYSPHADLSETLIIEHVVAYGDIPDMKKMVQLIDKDKILTVLNRCKQKYAKRANFIEKVIL